MGAADTESQSRAPSMLWQLGGFIFGLERLRYEFAIRLF